MDIKIPKSFTVKRRPYTIGDADLELQEDDRKGAATQNPLFVYMLKYLMAPMDEGLSDISESMRILLQPNTLAKVARYTHDMEVDEEEYTEHIKFAWKELNEAIMYSKEEIKDDKDKSLDPKQFVEQGILHILDNQKWIKKEEKKIINEIRNNMPESGKTSQFNEILDTVDDRGRPQIGRIGQQKIMGYRKGERSAKLYDAALGKNKFKPVLELLKRVEDESGDKGKISGKIDDTILIEYQHHSKTRLWKGQEILDMRTFTIHFDRAFRLLREEYGMNPKKEEVKDTIENSDVLEKWESVIDFDEKGYPKKQYAIGEINPDSQYLTWKRNNWNVDTSIVQELTDKEKFYLRRINIKLEWEKQLDKESVDEELIVRLYLYRIIGKDKLDSYMLKNSEGEFIDKFGEKTFDFNDEEFALIGKLLEDKEDKEVIETKLFQEYKILGMSKLAEKEAKRLRHETRPLIHGFPGGSFEDHKLFDDIGNPELKNIDLENVSSSEFRQELNKAITPGTAYGGEGKLKFSIGVNKSKDSGGYILLDIEFIPKKSSIKYTDYYARTTSDYGRWDKDERGKFIPSGFEEAKTKKPFPNRAEEGGQTLWINSVPNATMFLYYLKKQLMRLQKMVKNYV